MTKHRRRREPREVGHRDVVCRRANRFGCRHPAGAEDDRDVVSLDAGQFGQPCRGLRRSLESGEGAHASPARSSSTEVSPTDLHGRSRNSFT